MNHKFTHVRVGIEFFNTLTKNELYLKNQNAVYPAHVFLERIHTKTFNTSEEWIEYQAENISDIFDPYTNTGYLPYIDALIDLGLVNRDDSYVTQIEMYGKIVRKGSSKKYKLTQLGSDLISTDNTEYLHKLKTDAKIKRLNQKNKSEKRKNMKNYNDPVLDTINKNQHNIKINHDLVDKIIKHNNFEDKTISAITNNLINLETHTYPELKYNNSDSRVSHTWVQLKSEIRPALTINKMKVKYVLDIRACHPTFWSTYITFFLLGMLHSVPVKPDISSTLTKKKSEVNFIKEKELENEHKKWVELFTNPDFDGRLVISQSLGIDEDTTKELLNSALNGSENRVYFWIKENFPRLFEIWVETNVKKTGCYISQQFERDIIRNLDNYQLIQKLNLTIMDEHDGFSVFGECNDLSILSKLQYLRNYMVSYSTSRFGVPIIIKIKPYILNEDGVPVLTKHEVK